MQIKCPQCGQRLSVDDGLLGTEVQCPNCGSVLLLEVAAPAATPPPLPGPQVAAAGPTLVEEAVAAQSEPRRVIRPPAPPTAPAGAAVEAGEKPICYLSKGSDEAMAVSRAFRKLQEVFRTEGLDFQFVDLKLRPDALRELRPGDIHLTASVTVCKQGSRVARYFLGPLIGSAVGGACKLEVAGELCRAGSAPKPFTLKSAQSGGVLGGSGEGLMEANVKAIERQLPRKVAQWLTGRWILNADAYGYAVGALVLGLLCLIPFVGFLLFIPTFILSGVSWATISRRQLPKRKTMAIIGGILGLAGLIISIVMVANLR